MYVKLYISPSSIFDIRCFAYIPVRFWRKSIWLESGTNHALAQNTWFCHHKKTILTTIIRQCYLLHHLLLTWKSAHRRVIWMWYDLYCINSKWLVQTRTLAQLAAVSTSGSTLKISTGIRWTAVIFRTYVHDPKMMNLNDFDDSLSSPLLPPTAMTFGFSEWIVLKFGSQIQVPLRMNFSALVYFPLLFSP